MTYTIQGQVRCAVCGRIRTLDFMLSSSAIEPPDLDLRPSEVMRSTMYMWVQRCLSCGYCAPDLGKATEVAPSIIESDEYMRQLKDPEFPRLANSFLCCSLLSEKEGKYATAGKMAHYAAWCCDDKDKREGAKKCRLEALRLYVKAWEHGQEFAETADLEYLILVDLLRRTGQFEKAALLCADGLAIARDKRNRYALQFEQKLIAAHDESRHTIREAEEEEEEVKLPDEERCHDFLWNNPESPAPYCHEAYIADLFYMDYEKALEKYEVALQLAKRFEEGTWEFRLLEREGKSPWQILCAMGKILVKTQRYEEAVERYHEAAEYADESKIVDTPLIKACEETGRFEEAIMLLQGVAENFLEEKDYHFELGVLYERAGKIERAEKEIEEAIKDVPTFKERHHPTSEDDPVDRLLKVAYLAMMHGRKEKMRSSLTKAQELEPDNFIVNVMLGDIFYEDEDYERALDLYGRAVNSFPEESIKNKILRKGKKWLEDMEYMHACGIEDAEIYMARALLRIHRMREMKGGR